MFVKSLLAVAALPLFTSAQTVTVTGGGGATSTRTPTREITELTGCHGHDDDWYCIGGGREWEATDGLDDDNRSAWPTTFTDCRINDNDDEELQCTGGGMRVIFEEDDNHDDDHSTVTVTSSSASSISSSVSSTTVESGTGGASQSVTTTGTGLADQATSSAGAIPDSAGNVVGVSSGFVVPAVVVLGLFGGFLL